MVGCRELRVSLYRGQIKVGLVKSKNIPDGNHEIEIRRPEVRLHVMQVIDQARKETEERLLLEICSLLLV